MGTLIRRRRVERDKLTSQNSQHPTKLTSTPALSSQYSAIYKAQLVSHGHRNGMTLGRGRLLLHLRLRWWFARRSCWGGIGRVHGHVHGYFILMVTVSPPPPTAMSVLRQVRNSSLLDSEMKENGRTYRTFLLQLLNNRLNSNNRTDNRSSGEDGEELHGDC